MSDSKTFSNFKDAIFTVAVLAGIAGGIKMYSDIGKLENTDKRFESSAKKRSKQWGQIAILKNDVSSVQVNAAYEKGLRVGKESCEKIVK